VPRDAHHTGVAAHAGIGAWGVFYQNED